MLFDPSIELGLGTEFFRVGPRIDESARHLFGLIVQHLVQGSFRMGAFPAAGHQTPSL